jgi:hypothetical protein
MTKNLNASIVFTGKAMNNPVTCPPKVRAPEFMRVKHTLNKIDCQPTVVQIVLAQSDSLCR